MHGEISHVAEQHFEVGDCVVVLAVAQRDCDRQVLD
jgi:hypothetical protein